MASTWTDSRVLEEWFQIVGRCCSIAGKDAWYTKSDFAEYFGNAGEEFNGKLLTSLNEVEKAEFDKSLEGVLQLFAATRLIRTRGRQEYTPNLRLPKLTKEDRLTNFGCFLYSRRWRFTRRIILAVLVLFTRARLFAKRWWWIIAIAAAGSQLTRALDFLGLAFENLQGWLGHIVGILVGALVGFLLRRLIDALR